MNFINHPITAFEADATNGTITIEVDGTNLGDDFFVEKLAASATVEVSDGNNYIHSPYLNLTANYNIVFKDKEVERLCVQNWDTDGDLKLSYEEAAAVTSIKGVFGDYYNDNSSGVTKFVTFSTNIIEFNEFLYFTGVTTLNGNNFIDCKYLTKITIPSSVKSIGAGAFSGCTSLVEIYCQPTTPPSIYSRSDIANKPSFPFNSQMKIYVPIEAYNDYMQYTSSNDGQSKQNWYRYESYITPYNFE